ncbi:MAG: L-aspartate oxidase [Christensenellales bacterium]
MREMIFNGNLHDLARIDKDVIIIGCGAAGLYTALNLDPKLQCLILNKSGVQQSNSMYAQGGIAAVTPVDDQDDPMQHFNDTLTAGAGLCDEKAVKVLVDEAWSNIKELIDLKVPFDTFNGKLLLTREGGHGKNRIVHCGGDATGLRLTTRLVDIAMQRDNIQILNNTFLSDILTDEHGVQGVLVLDEEDKPRYYAASKVVVASGGIGRVYRNSTNAVCATGDGIAAAYRAGAELKDMEFVQFHPTALMHPDDNGRFFLISEALRGEGAILRNRRWEPFMKGVHPLADLAPRDIVSRAIIMEMKKNDIPNVFLDITNKSREFLKNRFPTIYRECMRRGIDIAENWIPVLPVQHYFMGGIKTDINATTNIPGLYACGEAACTGVHGANRLASNSLLECLVFGRRCAQHINGYGVVSASPPALHAGSYRSDEGVDLDSYSTEIRGLMTQKCSIIRNEKDLRSACVRIEEMFEEQNGIDLKTARSIETYNQSIIALAVLEAAIRRKISVGAHYRSDENDAGGK